MNLCDALEEPGVHVLQEGEEASQLFGYSNHTVMLHYISNCFIHSCCPVLAATRKMQYKKSNSYQLNAALQCTRFVRYACIDT